jgi:DNA-directed RNA polymerase specialized sigma24 family protein
MPECNSGLGGWIEELSDSRLSAKLRELPEADLELLTLLCVDGCSQAQAARVLGCTQQAVSKRLRKIKKYLA